MPDKESGFLTERDRAFLQADGDYYTGENAKNQRYETREKIAARARQAFRDFALLNQVLTERERDRIFDPAERGELTTAMWDTIAFLYHSLEGDAGRRPLFMRDRTYTTPFENVLETGVQRGEEQRHGEDFSAIVTVDFDVHVTPVSHESVDWDLVIEELAENGANRIDERELRVALSLATNPTDRLHELAEMIEEHRGSRGKSTSGLPSYDADAARSLSELIGDQTDGSGE